MDLEGTDCSDGLFRCVEGTVEASRRAVLPVVCGRTRGGAVERACLCPWDIVGRCASGCAVDGLEVFGSASRDAGPWEATQLCRPAEAVARPILPGDPVTTEVCATEGFRCVGGIVRGCTGVGRPSRAYAYCLNGCEPTVGVDDAVATWMNQPADGFASILCRRDHAERR